MNFFIPIGTVVAYAAEIDPNTYMSGYHNFSPNTLNDTGWLLCDGTKVMQSAFPKLFSLIGYTYGGSDNVFMLPDYRGYFLRALEPSKKIDTGFDTRKKADGSGKPASSIGSIEQCMVQMHEHAYNNFTVDQVMGGDKPPLYNMLATGTGGTTNLYTDSGMGTKLPGDETRPVNVYVNYLIFAGYYGRR